MSPALHVQRDGRVLHLTLNRPEKRNALSIELCRAIVETVQDAEEDRTVGAILLDAQGDVFCAGMDLHETLNPDIAEQTVIHERLFTLGARLHKPLVAAVRGPALAGGLGLVVNAHVALAAQGSTFGLTEIRIGMWPYVVFRLMKTALGERRAVELSLTGRVFGTPEAAAWGLVHHVTPAFELDDRAFAVASELANASADAIARGLEYVQRSRELSLDDAGELALHFRRATFNSADFAEGVRSFQEKRPPRWSWTE